MNKGELVQYYADKHNVTLTEAERHISAFTDTIISAIKDGKDIQLVGFGSWSISKRAARKGRNPQTGAVIDIKASNAVTFKAGQKLKDAVN